MPADAASIDDDRVDRVVQTAKRGLLSIGVSYAYDLGVLGGFSAAGYIDGRVVLLASILSALILAAAFWAHSSGWTRRLRDPTLFLPQQLSGLLIILGCALAAPQVGLPAMLLVMAHASNTLFAPSRRSLQIAGGVTLAGAAAVLFEAGPQFAAPAATLAGRCLIMAMFAGCLLRIIFVAMAFDKLRRRLRAKNLELEAALQRIDLLASIDDLTQVDNRRAIMQLATEHLALCGRLRQPLCVAMLDLDHFKRINDRFGHSVGDRVLRMFATEAAAALPDGHRLGRYGGEEFLAVLPATTARQGELVLRRVRDSVALAYWAAINPNLLITMTAGIAECRPGETLEEALRRADAALYVGKAQGRDRIVIAPSEPRDGDSRGRRRSAS